MFKAMTKSDCSRNGWGIFSTMGRSGLGLAIHRATCERASMKLENHCLIGHNGQPVPFVPARNAGGVIKPRYIVIHYTAGGSADSTVRYLASRTSARFGSFCRRTRWGDSSTSARVRNLPQLANSMPIEWLLSPLIPCHWLLPACQAARSQGTC